MVKTAFVAIPYNEEIENIYEEAIKSAILDSKLIPVLGKDFKESV